jgi:hypothetical protein
MDIFPPESQDTATSADTNSYVDISINKPIVRNQSGIQLVCEGFAKHMCANRPNELQQHTSGVSILQKNNLIP